MTAVLESLAQVLSKIPVYPLPSSVTTFPEDTFLEMLETEDTDNAMIVRALNILDDNQVAILTEVIIAGYCKNNSLKLVPAKISEGSKPENEPSGS